MAKTKTKPSASQSAGTKRRGRPPKALSQSNLMPTNPSSSTNPSPAPHTQPTDSFDTQMRPSMPTSNHMPPLPSPSSTALRPVAPSKRPKPNPAPATPSYLAGRGLDQLDPVFPFPYVIDSRYPRIAMTVIMVRRIDLRRR